MALEAVGLLRLGYSKPPHSGGCTHHVGVGVGVGVGCLSCVHHSLSCPVRSVVLGRHFLVVAAVAVPQSGKKKLVE